MWKRWPALYPSSLPTCHSSQMLSCSVRSMSGVTHTERLPKPKQQGRAVPSSRGYTACVHSSSSPPVSASPLRPVSTLPR